MAAIVVGLYPHILHNGGPKAWKNMFEVREHKAMKAMKATEDLVNMLHFVLENKHVKFNGGIEKQIPGTAISTNFALPYVCIFMDKLKIKFLQSQKLQPLVWFRYINEIFFIWTHAEDKLEKS